MSASQAILAVGTALAALGIACLLPGSTTRTRMLGGVLAALGFGCLGSLVPTVGDWFTVGFFRVIAAVTIVAAVATVSFRSPVYCAIWFGMTLAGTAGMFLLAGAEFLAIATLVVYAGAILVTFLFVLMLSQPEGHTSYDRRSREPLISAVIGAVLVAILTTMIGSAITDAEKVSSAEAVTGAGRPLAGRGPVSSARAKNGKRESMPHSATEPAAYKPSPLPQAPYTISRLGATLFTRYLIAVEAAGALLFAALVGAAVIVTQGRAAMKRPATAGAPGTPGRGGISHAS